jgi:hypothetical protein
VRSLRGCVSHLFIALEAECSLVSSAENLGRGSFADIANRPHSQEMLLGEVEAAVGGEEEDRAMDPRV